MVNIHGIKLKNVSFGYSSEESLFSNTSYDFETQKKHAIVGASGVGKTTLLKLLMGIVSPLEGEVNYLCANEEFKPRIGYVSQSYSLFPWLTVSKNIELGAFEKSLNKDEVEERIRSLCDRFGLLKAIRMYPRELSGGMKQRTAVARAICGEPDILFFDEPFSALDIASKIQARGIINEAVEKSRLTTFFVTHDIHEAVLLTDFVHVMRKAGSEILIECIAVTQDNRSMVESLITDKITGDLQL